MVSDADIERTFKVPLNVRSNHVGQSQHRSNLRFLFFSIQFFPLHIKGVDPGAFDTLGTRFPPLIEIVCHPADMFHSGGYLGLSAGKGKRSCKRAVCIPALDRP